MQIQVRVIPRARKERIEESAQGLKVYLSVPARQGRANKRLIELLAEHFSTRKRCICIEKGASSRDKIVRIEHC